jgi:hypothetical protein
MEDVRFCYVEVPRRKTPVTVAYSAQERPDGIVVQYGVSFCNDKDRFNRRLGREIAEGRLRRRPLTRFVDFGEGQKFGLTIVNSLREHIKQHRAQLVNIYVECK